MNIRILIILSLFCCVQLNAQSFTPFVIATAGHESENPDGSLVWTLGELSIQTLEGEKGILTQGFHQPDYKIIPLGNTEVSDLSINVFPNPVIDNLQIATSASANKSYGYQLFNVQGQLILEKSDIQLPYSISGFDLSQGTYVLRVYEGSQPDEYAIFKILKL